MIEVTDEQVISELRAVVAEQPDFVYSAPEYMKASPLASCFYVHTDADGSNERPGCGIGVLLHRLGVPLNELAQREGDSAFGVARDLLGDLSRGTYDALDTFQGQQDSGETWADSLAEALGE